MSWMNSDKLKIEDMERRKEISFWKSAGSMKRFEDFQNEFKAQKFQTMDSKTYYEDAQHHNQSRNSYPMDPITFGRNDISKSNSRNSYPMGPRKFDKNDIKKFNSSNSYPMSPIIIDRNDISESSSINFYLTSLNKDYKDVQILKEQKLMNSNSKAPVCSNLTVAIDLTVTLDCKDSSEDESWYCESCKVNFTSKTSLNAHIRGAKHQRNINSIELLKQLQSQGYAEPNDTEKSTFYCNVCDVSLNGVYPLKDHIDGSKHKKKVKNSSEEVQMLSCDVCGINVNSSEQYANHMQSKKHKIKEGTNLLTTLKW